MSGGPALELRRSVIRGLALLPVVACAPAVLVPDAECLATAPTQVLLRDRQQSFNIHHQAWLCRGSVYVSGRSDVGAVEWQRIWLPDGLLGDAAALAMDDRFLHVANGAGAIWFTAYASGPVDGFDWSRHQGMPYGLGDANHLEPGFLAWTLSSASAEEDVHYTDASGWLRDVGWATCTHMFLLKQDGQHIGFNDGWLPADWNYEMCTPRRGRFVAVNLASSGARHMLINRLGDIFTRIYDYDVSGANNGFEDYFDYTYDDQRGVTADAARRFQLPPWPWFEQPKIDGRITDRISLHKVGRDGRHALMRVEGWDGAGVSGYYEKDMDDVVENLADATGWRFVSTGLPIGGRELDNRPAPSADQTLGPAEDACFADDRDVDGWRLELLASNPYCSPAVLRVHISGGLYYDLVLHTTETLRLQRIAGRGLQDTPRPRSGAIEVPANLVAAFERGELHSTLRTFIAQRLAGQRFSWVDVEASRSQVVLRQNGGWPWGSEWRLDAVDCAATSQGDNDGRINDPGRGAGPSHGFVFEELFLDDRAAQIGQHPVTGVALPSRRNIHSFDDLLRRGW